MYASKDFCFAIYIITGLKNTDFVWGKDPTTEQIAIVSGPLEKHDEAPAYDLYFLLNLLKEYEPMVFYEKGGNISENPLWAATIQDDDGLFLQFDEDNPANAVCKLIMKLVKEGAWHGTQTS